jgi:beta-lactamase class A
MLRKKYLQLFLIVLVACQTITAVKKTVSYDSLKTQLTNILSNNVCGKFSIYVEDLSSGKWMGINEDERYNAWSLLKVPIMVTVLKKVELKKFSLDTKISLKGKQYDTYALQPIEKISDNSATVKTLIERLITLSDNTASAALAGLFTADEFQQNLFALGLPRAPPDKPKNYLPLISPKQYANMLRSLYYSKYLKKQYCQLVLSLLSKTIYDSQIKKSLPSKIKVAHKVGFNAGCGEFHDCGIVYLPDRPYIISVMSAGSTREEADKVISSISKIVYEYFEKK